jgi:serine/threonine protein kinase
MSMRLAAPAEAQHTRAVDGTVPGGRVVAHRYQLQALLGRGGMGRVWLAFDMTLRRAVALKQILLDERATAWECALREARAAACVDHGGAVTIFDIVTDGGLPWIVMEALPGRTLREVLDDAGPLPVEQVARVGLCLLDVLAQTHRAGIVHLDVKPSNVHLCDDDRVVLTDFGIAATVSGPPSAGGTFSGSPAYIAPERLDGDEVGPAADLFSLGATLFAAVEGVAPFDRGSVRDTFIAVAAGARAPFRRAGRLRPVIEGLLARDPDRRPGVDETRAALRASS